MTLSVIAETPFSLVTKVNAVSDPENLVFDVGEGPIVIGADTIAYYYNDRYLTQNYNPASDTVTITGTVTPDMLYKTRNVNHWRDSYSIITVEKDVSVNIVLKNVNINTCGNMIDDLGAFYIEDNSIGNVNITLEGENILNSGFLNDGIQRTNSVNSGWLTIDGTGSLVVEGTNYSISGYNIKINGGIVTAINGFENYREENSNIIINGGSVKLDESAHHDTFDRNNITNENGDKVYPLILALNDSISSVLIDNKLYPINHSISNKLYVWVTGESHEVIVNGNIVKYINFDTTSKRFVSAEENKFIISPTNNSNTLIDGTDYTYVDGVLTILSNKPITIANTDPMIATITDVIKVKKDVSANITLSNVNIEPIVNNAALEIADNSIGDVIITLPEGTINTLIGGFVCAGLQKNGDIGTLTINGKGTLYADGGNAQGAAIGAEDGSNSSNITINDCTIITYWSGIGGGDDGRYDPNAGNGSNININNSTIIAHSDGGACIGGGCRGNGSNININNSTIIAHSESAACIGGGSGEGEDDDGNGSNITITNSTINAISNWGAGIGGGEEGNGSNITITNSTINAISRKGASIGGGMYEDGLDISINNSNILSIGNIGSGEDGNNSDVIINGGVVYTWGTIGGGSDTNTFKTNKEDGTPGDAWIYADLITDNDDTSNWSGVIFQNNGMHGHVYGNQVLNTDRELYGDLEINKNATLTINANLTIVDHSKYSNIEIDVVGGTLNGSGTIRGDGECFTIELTPDMISVPNNTPPGLVYTGWDETDFFKNSARLTTKTYCNREFEVIGYNDRPTITKNSELEYIVTYTPVDIPIFGIIAAERTSISKPVVLSQSGTRLSANFADSHSSYYTQGDTITITGTVEPTGEAPIVMALTEPTPGQVVAYNGTTQVSEPVTPAADGSYSLIVPTQDIGTGIHTLTVKYIETEVMAQQTLDVNVGVIGEGVTPANDSLVYTFKTNLNTNKTDTIVPNVTLNYNISAATDSDLTDDTKVGIGAPIVSSSVFTTADAFTDKSISKNATVDFTGITFTAAGIYRYVLQESLAEEVSGLVIDDDKRYLDVYVENNTDDTLKIMYYVLQTASGTKTDSFNNQYDVFEFSVNNTVTGNSGDKLKDFTYTVTFDSNTIKSANIIANGATTEDNITYTVLLKDNENIEFKNVPKSAKYTVIESNNTGYITTINKTGSDVDNAIDNSIFTFSDSVDGITDDTQLAFTNNKDSVIPTGVILAVAIPVIVGAAMITAIIIFIIIKKRDNDEEEDEVE